MINQWFPTLVDMDASSSWKEPVKFGYKLWVAETPFGYTIQFYPCMDKDNFFDPDLELEGSAVDKLTNSLSKHDR